MVRRPPSSLKPTVIDSLLLAATRIATFEHEQPLTQASGFFFERDARLFLATSRHVMFDEASGHRPNRITIELHTSASRLSASSSLSLMLYDGGMANWRQGTDSGGEVDIALLEIDRGVLPPDVVLQAFTPAHLAAADEAIEIGSSLLIVGFPLGFHDTVHHLPVVRQAVLASAFGIRFQGLGYFLTDARTHRGTSGAPVVLRNPAAAAHDALPWKLLGAHSGRLDMSGRDLVEDETLGLNCAWYADILTVLSQDPPAQR